MDEDKDAPRHKRALLPFLGNHRHLLIVPGDHHCLHFIRLSPISQTDVSIYHPSTREAKNLCKQFFRLLDLKKNS